MIDGSEKRKPLVEVEQRARILGNFKLKHDSCNKYCNCQVFDSSASVVLGSDYIICSN